MISIIRENGGISEVSKRQANCRNNIYPQGNTPAKTTTVVVLVVLCIYVYVYINNYFRN